MGRLRDYVTGRDLTDEVATAAARFPGESRSLAPTTSFETFDFAPVRATSLPPISQAAALRIADVYACCRVLADGVASLPPKVFRDTDAGRIPAGADQRLVQLLKLPSPGSTSADLFSTAMVHLLVSGNCFIGKHRSDQSIVQLACLDPQSITVEQQGARIVYLYSGPEGLQELTTADVVHVKAMSSDGLRGLSPVQQTMRTLQLNQALVTYLSSWLGNDSRPGGVLTVADGLGDLDRTKQDAEETFGWRASPPGHGRVAVVSGEVAYHAIDPALKDSELVAQRELSAREVARAMRVPPWSIGATTGDSLTYANSRDQARHLLDFSIRPWLTKIEAAFNADADLLPGSAYMAFDTDAMTRMDPDGRAAFYEKGLAGGWLTVDEVRSREDLPPIGGQS